MRGWDISYWGFICPATPERAFTELPNFSWGLLIDGELQDPVVANVFWRWLTWNNNLFTKAELAVVEVCHHHGWIQSGISLEKVCYMFSLPLHATYVSWKLIPSTVECPFMPTQDMTFAIIKKFTPSQDIGISGMIHQSPLNGIKHRMGHLHGWDVCGISVWQSRRR
jgi:hypothetical protein